MSTPQTRGKLSVFDSVADEAAFWDSHSTAEFESEWEAVEVEVAPNRSDRRVINSVLDDETADQLYAVARWRGVGAADLIQSWLVDSLSEASNEDSGERDMGVAGSGDLGGQRAG